MTLAAQLASDLPHGLAGSLEGVAHELRLLQTQVQRMQDACEAPDANVGLDVVLLRELQGLDLLSQSLSALTGFVGGLLEALPYDPALDISAALRALTLQDIANRLTAHAAGGELPDQDAVSGDFDLF